MYGVLSGDLESVLPMCHTWDDHLWAHLNHLIIARSVNLSPPKVWSLKFLDRIDGKLHQAGGYWHDRFGTGPSDGSSDEDLEQVFERIEKVQRDGVS